MQPQPSLNLIPTIQQAIAGLLMIIAGSWLSTDGRLPPGLAAVVTRWRPRRRRRPASEHAAAEKLPAQA